MENDFEANRLVGVFPISEKRCIFSIEPATSGTAFKGLRQPKFSPDEFPPVLPFVFIHLPFAVNGDAADFVFPVGGGDSPQR